MEDHSSSTVAGAEDHRSQDAPESLKPAPDIPAELTTAQHNQYDTATPCSLPRQCDSSRVGPTNRVTIQEDLPEVLQEELLTNSGVPSLADCLEVSSDDPEEVEFFNPKSSAVRLDGYVYDEEGLTIGSIVEGLPWILEGCNLDTSGNISDANGQTIGCAARFPTFRETFYINHYGNVYFEGCSSPRLGKLVEGGLGGTMTRHVISSNGKVWSYAETEGVCVGRIDMFRSRHLTPDELRLMPVVEGLKLCADGMVYDRRGDPVAHLISGDVETYVGREPAEDGDLGDRPENCVRDEDGRVAPLRAAEQLLKFASINGCRVHLDGRVRNEDGKVLARFSERKITHSIGCNVFDRGEVWDDNENYVGLAELLEDAQTHSNEGDCPPSCFHCISEKLERIPYDEQIDLLAQEIDAPWRGWPEKHVVPRIDMFGYNPTTDRIRETKFPPERSHRHVDDLLRYLDEETEDPAFAYVICVIENINRHLARQLGDKYKIWPEFFYEHYRPHFEEGTGEDMNWETSSSGPKRGSMQGYLRYTERLVDRHIEERQDMPHISTRMSYYWVDEQLLLLLVDGTDNDKLRAANAAWGEWAFSNMEHAGSFLMVPLPHDSVKYDLFDLIYRAISVSTAVITWTASLLGSPTYGCLFPDLLFLLSLEVLFMNQLILGDKIRYVSFQEIQNPNKETNKDLHALRAELHYNKEKTLHIRVALTQFKPAVAAESDVGSDTGQGTVPTTASLDGHYELRMRHTLESISRSEQLLMETFQLLISSLSAADNERNLKQGRRSNLLTVLAFIYVPLSFVTGIFGMNVKSVNGSPLPYWVCLITLAIVLASTFCMWLGHFLWGQHVQRREDKQREREKMA